MAEEEFPGQVSLDEIRRGMNSDTRMRPVHNQQDPDGTYVITYSFIPRLENAHPDVSNVRALNEAQRQALFHAMRQYEEGVPLRHEETSRAKHPGVRFAQVHTDEWNGETSSLPGNRSEVLITDNLPPEAYRFGRVGYYIIAHELGHVYGLRHIYSKANSPPDDGWSIFSDKDISAMSYRPGKLHVQGVGPADIMTLQQPDMYGLPRHSTPRGLPRRVDPTDTSFLWNAEPLTLVLDPGENSYGYVNVHLGTKNFSHQMEGSVKKAGDKEEWPVGVRFVPDTVIEDVRMVSDSQVSLNITGNDLPNFLRGGGGDDNLRARSGHDSLTGGEGRDNFIFDADSGRYNVVTDFRPAEDRLVVKRGIDRVELKECTLTVDDAPVKGTQAVFLDGLDAIAETFIQNVRAKEVAKSTLSSAEEKDISIDILPPQLPRQPSPRRAADLPLTLRGRWY